MQSLLFMRLLAVFMIVTLALVKPVPGKKLKSHSRPTGDSQSNAAFEAIFDEWMRKESHHRRPVSYDWSSVSIYNPRKLSSNYCSDLGCCDTENGKDEIKVIEEDLLDAFDNLETARSELEQAKEEIAYLQQKLNSTTEMAAAAKIITVDENLLVTLEHLKTSKIELAQAKNTIADLEKKLNSTSEIAADKIKVLEANLLVTLDNLKTLTSNIAQAKETIAYLEKKINSTVSSSGTNLQDCVETLFVANAMVIDVPLNASKCKQQFVTDKNHVLVFTVVGKSGYFESVQEFLSIHDGLGANSSVLLFENQTINEFSNKKFPDAIYTTDSIGEIRFKMTPTSAFKLKIQKAVKCPVNLGGGTICGRFVDEISCYCMASNLENQAYATSYCYSKRMNLLSLESESEEKAIRSIWSSTILHVSIWTTKYWTSGSLKIGGPWIWESTGLNVEYTNWGKGEPNNDGGNEHCLMINFSSDLGGWNDGPCNKEIAGIICEDHP